MLLETFSFSISYTVLYDVLVFPFCNCSANLETGVLQIDENFEEGCFNEEAS